MLEMIVVPNLFVSRLRAAGENEKMSPWKKLIGITFLFPAYIFCFKFLIISKNINCKQNIYPTINYRHYTHRATIKLMYHLMQNAVH